MKECVVDREGSPAQMLLIYQYVILKAGNSITGIAEHIVNNLHPVSEYQRRLESFETSNCLVED
jgi:hypothetical protein